MRLAKHSRRQSGDTIVEVLISIAILGFVVSAAYSLATRNQIATLKAQERARAATLVESQVESLRSYIEEKKNPDDITQDNFCFVDDDTDTNPLRRKAIIPVAAPDKDINIDKDTDYGGCTEENGLYRISVWKPTTAKDIGARLDSNATYAVTVRWETAGGGSYDEVKTFYTIFPRTDP